MGHKYSELKEAVDSAPASNAYALAFMGLPVSRYKKPAAEQARVSKKSKAEAVRASVCAALNKVSPSTLEQWKAKLEPLVHSGDSAACAIAVEEFHKKALAGANGAVLASLLGLLCNPLIKASMKHKVIAYFHYVQETPCVVNYALELCDPDTFRTQCKETDQRRRMAAWTRELCLHGVVTSAEYAEMMEVLIHQIEAELLNPDAALLTLKVLKNSLPPPPGLDSGRLERLRTLQSLLLATKPPPRLRFALEDCLALLPACASSSAPPPPSPPQALTLAYSPSSWEEAEWRAHGSARAGRADR